MIMSESENKGKHISNIQIMLVFWGNLIKKTQSKLSDDI